MSDTSQGHGWWVADDGKWYPPELHPEYRPAAPPAPAAPAAQPRVATRPLPPVAAPPYPTIVGSQQVTRLLRPQQAWWNHPALVIPLLFLCWPVGVGLVWTTLWETKTKVIATAVSIGAWGLYMLATSFMSRSEAALMAGLSWM